METSPHWRRIWRAITGKSIGVTPNIIVDVFTLTKDHLPKGIITYPAFTEDSFTNCSEKIKLKDHPALSKFIRQLSVALNLDAGHAWGVFCNYLMFEYYGKVQAMQEITDCETSAINFITKIWQFYTLERAYLLRALQYVVENHKNTSHKFHQQFSTFIENVTYKKLQEYLFNQYYHLIKEISEEKSKTIIKIIDKVERNNAELLQTLLLILTTIKYEKFGITEFLQMFKLLKEHSFTPTSEHLAILKLSRPKVLESIQSVEFAVFVASIENFWFNQDEWYSHIDEIEKIIKEIFSTNNGSVFLLTWAALQSTLPGDLAREIYFENSHIYVGKALENYVFVDLCKVVSNSIFQDSIAGVVAKTSIYKLFDLLCIQFEAHNVYIHDGAVSLLSQFLRTPELANLWKHMEGVSAFVIHATRLFPHHYEALSNFVESSISLKKDTQLIVEELANLDTFTESYIRPEQRGPYIRNNVLLQTYKPLGNDLIVFPPLIRAAIVKKHEDTLIEIHANWSYFKHLTHAVNNFIGQVQKEHRYEEQTQKIVLKGYKLILEVLKADPEVAWGNADIKNLLHLALCLFSTSLKSRTKNLELMKMCFEITIHVFKHDPANIVRAMIAIEFLPKLSKENISSDDFIMSLFISEATLFQHIDDEFSHSQSCDLLLLYIQLVNEAMKMDMYFTKLQIPGCMFLLVKVFPIFTRHLFTDDVKRQKVIVDLVKLIHKILKKNPNSLTKPDLTLYNCVMELFLKSTFHAKSLMKVFQCGNNKLQLLLTTEMNWKSGQRLFIVKSIKRALKCVLIILEFIQVNSPENNKLFVEEVLYWQPSSNFSFLKPISSYVNHCFDSEIPKIACNILTAFVKVSNSPLIHSLQLDDYQLQCLFLERLRDPLDDPEMKVAVIRLVIACVKEQNSMTSGFFNMSPKGEHSDVNILSFIDEYLKNIERNPNSLLIPIQRAILDLFHELWKNHRQHLLNRAIDQESFWKSLTTPLLKPNHVPIEVLLQILEIVVLDVHFSYTNVNEKFTKELKTLFGNSKEFLFLWIDRLIATSHNNTLISDSSQLPLCIVFLAIWKKFMFTVKLFNPDYFEREWNKSFLVQKCLDGLLSYTEKPKKFEVLISWAELLMIFGNFPVIENITEKKDIFFSLTKIVNNFSQFYEIANDTCRIVMLTVITTFVTNFKEFLATNPAYIMPFLTPLEKIFFYEFKVRFAERSRNEDQYRNWLLVLRIIRTFLQLDTLSYCEHFFIHIRFVERMMEVLELCVFYTLPVRVTEVTAMTLVEFANTPLIHHFEYTNLLLTSASVLPPKKHYLQRNHFPNGIIPQHLKDWWSIYLHIVRLSYTLLRRRRSYVLKYILEFVNIHQVILVDSLLSATVLADSTNLELVKEILRFIYAVLEYKQEWNSRYEKSFSCIMATIKEVLNASIGVILRPKCLIFVRNDPNPTITMQIETVVPTQNLIDVTNSHLEIMAWACKCFTRCNPPSIDLLHLYRPADFKVFVEYDFRVPPAMDENTQILTYGSVLCALHFVCKVLSQIFFQEKEKYSESSVTTPKGDASSTPAPSFASTPTPTSETPLKKRKYFNVLILPSYTKETRESINVLHSFAVPDIMESQPPWLINLNPDILMLTLNALTTFLAGQAFVTARDVKLERNLKRYVKRELCFELRLFYDFVNKYLGDKYLPTEEDQSATSGTDVRVMATPRRAHGRLRIKPRDRLISKSCSEGKLFVDLASVCTGRPSGKRTEIVDVDDCYLLTLVHWFRHVCRLVHYSKFDEFLSKWHAKSTYVMKYCTYVKNTSVSLSDEEEDKMNT